MYHLAIETSVTPASMALLQHDKLLEEKMIANPRQTSALLASSIDELFKTAHITAKDLSFISVGIGPGSFTGLRAGLATAKGLAFANNTTIIAVDSLQALANGYVQEKGWPNNVECVLAIYDARRGNCYLGGIYKNGHVIDSKRIMFNLKSFYQKICVNLMVVSPHSNAFFLTTNKKSITNLFHFENRAFFTGRFGLNVFNKTNHNANPSTIKPLYLTNNYTR